MYILYKQQDCNRLHSFARLIKWLKSAYTEVFDNSSALIAVTPSNEYYDVKSGEPMTDLTRRKLNVTDAVFDILHDMAMLTSFNKLILPKSTFGFWGGLIGNAAEVIGVRRIFFELL